MFVLSHAVQFVADPVSVLPQAVQYVADPVSVLPQAVQYVADPVSVLPQTVLGDVQPEAPHEAAAPGCLCLRLQCVR